MVLYNLEKISGIENIIYALYNMEKIRFLMERELFKTIKLGETLEEFKNRTEDINKNIKEIEILIDILMITKEKIRKQKITNKDIEIYDKALLYTKEYTSKYINKTKNMEEVLQIEYEFKNYLKEEIERT